ncbi:MAG: F0F1 ATP synthase subunit B' [Albidovulum sp.]|nr:F0F1 ATP synthase subunit B' [Albidovulum sp.]
MATATDAAENPVGIPQLDFSTFPNQIFWLIVALLAIYIVVKRIAIPRIGGILEQRAARMESDLELAEELSKQAATLEEESRAMIAEAKSEAEKISAKARDEVRQLTESAMDEVSYRISGMTAVAEARIEEIRRNAQEGIVEIAQDAAYEIVALLLPGKEDRTAAAESVRGQAGGETQ